MISVLLVISLSTLAAVLLAWILTRGFSNRLFAALMAVFLGLGLAGWRWLVHVDDYERPAYHRDLTARVAEHAAAMAELDLESLPLESAGTHPRELSVTTAIRNWLGGNPELVSEVVARRDANGKARIVAFVSRPDRGDPAQWEGYRKGAVYPHEDAMLDSAFQGKTAVGESPFHDGAHIQTQVYCPVPARQGGGVGAVLIVVADSGPWLERIRNEAPLKVLIGGLGLLALLSLVAAACFMMREKRARAEIRKLAGELARLDSLVDCINGIVWECEAATLRFTYVSRKAKRILGYSSEEWTDFPNFRASIVHPEDKWVIAHCRNMAHLRRPYEFDYRVVAEDGGVLWMRETGCVITDATGAPVLMRGILQDVSRIKEVNKEVETLHRSLLEASRHAGMAEVATSVLHNVGNLLNSIGVSATLVSDRVRGSKAGNLRQAVVMMRGHGKNIGQFLGEDAKGRLIPEYLDNATGQMVEDQETIVTELSLLCEHIEHVKDIIAMQQSLASVSGVYEFLHPAELADDALRMTGDELSRGRIRTVREYCVLPPRVKVDRHKVLQILVNLLRNAMQALESIHTSDKLVAVRVETVSGGEMVAIRVKDNGVGIAPEHLSEIFRHGFTTKKDGHGFGLHGAANFAQEMGGSLVVKSEGSGLGAEFTLTLPIQ